MILLNPDVVIPFRKILASIYVVFIVVENVDTLPTTITDQNIRHI
jgi:hypothetical protein